MALQKQNYNMNFAAGLDLKTDPNQVPAGKFLILENAVFQNGGGLQKRNGFGNLTALSNTAGSTITTLNSSLVATGSVLQAYNANNDQWVNQGTIQPVTLHSASLTRNSTSQTAVDSAISSNGLVCTVYLDNAVSYYQITDVESGQMLIPRTALPSTAVQARVNTLGRYFIISFLATVAGNPNLRYISIPLTGLSSPAAAITVSTAISSITTGYDCVTANNNVYYAWNGNDGGGAVRAAYLTSTLIVSATHVAAGFVADKVAITADNSTPTPTIWVSFYTSGTTTIRTMALSATLASVLAPTSLTAADTVIVLTNYATAGVCTTIWEVSNAYPSAVRSDYIRYRTCTTAASLGTNTIMTREVGLASKAFADSSTIYMLTAYNGTYQPTYFLQDLNGNVLAKVAYSNGGGYVTTQVLANVNNYNSKYYIPHLIKDLLVALNKANGASVGGVYTQTGINLTNFAINISAQYSNEIAQSLQLTGGFVWQYDSVKPVEHSFHLWPEDATVSTSGAGGSITAQLYYYRFCYEWTDAQGNLHRSAPSIPISVTTAGATSTNTLVVPTLRLTYKTGQNPVRIVGYRWSTAQPVFYQFTSLSTPTLNDITVDKVTITDTAADSSILGNTLLYTTGGVVENIAAPAAAATTLYKSRQFILDAEDRNVLWYSKQVIQNTPVEFSDLFTLYVPPTTGAQGSTGEVTAISAMDDKLIIFKADAIYYVTGIGPDNTGANNDFSDPVYISGTVGTTTPNSIVFTPAGLMFQSDKGIWLLGRDLSTKYVGAPVEGFNAYTVLSALTISGTNEVRFNLNNGVVLMYDYYYDQWGTFSGVPGISSTLYNGRHTYLNSLGQVRQETPGLYLDGSNPVLLKFTTAWLKLTGLQGYQRVYFMYLLSNFITPYKLSVQIGYDYSMSVNQSVLLTPAVTPSLYGDQNLWGGGTWGGDGTLDQRRVFLNQQKCQAIQVTVSEVYNPEFGTAAGAGLTMSGINFIVGAKDNKPKLAASQSAS